MAITLQRPRTIQAPTTLVAGLAALVVAAGAAFGLGLFDAGQDTPAGSHAPARAFPGALSAAERAAVTHALSSRDPRRQRIGRQVAAGEAGASALADPATLHHHGLDTSPAEPDTSSDALRFHHRSSSP